MTARRNIANAERSRAHCCLVRYLEHTTATADSEVVRLDRLEEVACDFMGPMLRDIIDGNWCRLCGTRCSAPYGRGVNAIAKRRAL